MTGPATLKSWLDAISGDEKFLMVVGAGVVDTLLLIFHFINPDHYVTLTTITVGAYIAGKTYENTRPEQ